MKSWLLAATAVFAPITFVIAADANSITVGQATLSLPAPENFERLDTEEAISSEVRESILTPSNRLLAYFAPNSEFKETFKPIFHAQTPRGTEAIVYSIQRFQEMSVSLAGLLGAGSGGLPKNGETSSLGVYDRGDHHLNFASLSRTIPEDDNANNGTLTYVAASMNNIAGSVVNLYCVVPAEPESNQVWAREQITNWQQAVQSSNPTPLPEAKAQAISPMKRGAIIGSITGLIGALIGMALLKNRKSQSSAEA